VASCTGRCSLAITAIASNRLWGHHIAEQFRGPAVNRQLGDPTLRGRQFGLLGTGQARDQAPVNPVLSSPHRPIAH
jgi:hypothetical protein